MSYSLIEWARNQRLDPGPKNVLMALCLRADTFGSCFPSQNKIAEDTGYSVRSVRRYIKKLEECGLIEKKRRQKGYIRRSDSYTIQPHPQIQSATHSSEKKKMAHANRDMLSAAEQDSKPIANESTDKNTYEVIKKNYIKILDQKVFTGDRGEKSNPLWFTGQIITLFKREFEAFCSAYPAFSEDQLWDLLEQQDRWLSDEGNNAKSYWLAITLKFLKTVHDSHAETISNLIVAED